MNFEILTFLCHWLEIVQLNCYYFHYYPFCKQFKLYSCLWDKGWNALAQFEHGNEKDFDEESRKNQHTRGGKLDVKGISNIIIIMKEGDASSKLAWLCVGRKSCSSGEDRDKSQVCARHKAATFCAHNVCYAREGIIRSRKQQNLRDLLWPKVKFLQILFLNILQVQIS